MLVSLPEEVNSLLSRVPEALTRLLGTNLVGLYVYGSLFEASFDPSRSDVDRIAVTEQALAELEFHQLKEWLTEAAAINPWYGRLQMSFLIRGHVLAEDPRACLFQFGVLERTGSDGNPLIWMDFFQRGRTLWGAPPESFLPEITPAIFHQALVREVGYLSEELCVKTDSRWRDDLCYRVYAVLTLCRILYSARTGRVTSKTRAGQWALDRASLDRHDLIRQVVENRESCVLEDVPVSHLCGFIEHARSQVDSGPPVSPNVDAVRSLESD